MVALDIVLDYSPRIPNHMRRLLVQLSGVKNCCWLVGTCAARALYCKVYLQELSGLGHTLVYGYTPNPGHEGYCMPVYRGCYAHPGSKYTWHPGHTRVWTTRSPKFTEAQGITVLYWLRKVRAWTLNLAVRDPKVGFKIAELPARFRPDWPKTDIHRFELIRSSALFSSCLVTA